MYLSVYWYLFCICICVFWKHDVRRVSGGGREVLEGNGSWLETIQSTIHRWSLAAIPGEETFGKGKKEQTIKGCKSSKLSSYHNLGIFQGSWWSRLCSFRLQHFVTFPCKHFVWMSVLLRFVAFCSTRMTSLISCSWKINKFICSKAFSGNLLLFLRRLLRLTFSCVLLFSPLKVEGIWWIYPFFEARYWICCTHNIAYEGSIHDKISFCWL